MPQHVMPGIITQPFCYPQHCVVHYTATDSPRVPLFILHSTAVLGDSICKMVDASTLINEAQSSVTLIDPVLTATGAFRYDPHSVFIALVSSTENYRLIGLERILRGQTVFIATIR